MSTDLIKAGETPVTALQRLLKANEGAIRAVLPQHMNPQRLTRLAVTALHQTPRLQNCSMLSICNSFMLSAQLGLEINNGLGHGWLIPYGQVCTFQPGYRGLIDLATRGGMVHDIQAHVVYANDAFDLEYGDNQRCIHKPALKDRGEWIGAYCHVRYKDGPPSSLFLFRDEIEKIRDRSSKAWQQDNKGSVWALWQDEMVRKTPTKRHLKYVKLSSEIALAVGIDDQAESHAANVAEQNGKPFKEPEIVQDMLLEGDFLQMAEEATDNLKGSAEKREEILQERLETERHATRRGRPPKPSATSAPGVPPNTGATQPPAAPPHAAASVPAPASEQPGAFLLSENVRASCERFGQQQAHVEQFQMVCPETPEILRRMEIAGAQMPGSVSEREAMIAEFRRGWNQVMDKKEPA